MIDKAVVIDGLGAIRKFFEIGQPSQAITFDSYQNIIDGAIELIHDQQSQIAMLVATQHELREMMKEQECAKIKEPDCRICGQSHCKYYHESRKPTECKSYVCVDWNPSPYEIKQTDKTDGYNLKELWKRARAGVTLSETELNFLLADWDERDIFKQQEEGR